MWGVRHANGGQAMMICLWQHVRLSNVAAKRLTIGDRAASALAPLSLGISEPALAQCASPPSATTCTSGGNSYPNGINVDATNLINGFSTGINLTLQPAVKVDIPTGAGGVNAVNAANSTGVSPGSANININVTDNVTINNAANPLSNNNTGLRIQSSGSAIISATNTAINVAGTASDWAILAFAHPQIGNLGSANMASVTWSGPGLNSTSGVEGGAIQADNRGNGDAIVVASGGTINVVGIGNSTTQYGLLAHAGDSLFFPAGPGNASVTYNSGTLNVSAIRPRGILAWVGGDGSAMATTAAGTVINVSGTQLGGPGVYVFSGFGTATAANKLTANVASEITSSGPETTNPGNLPAGIRAVSGAGAQIDVTYTGPGITTSGGNGTGITALSSGIGNITVNSFGPINTTTGSNAVGILADSSGTILRRSPGLLNDIQPINPVLRSITGSVQVNTSQDVLAQGEFGTGISASSGSGAVTVNVQAGSVMGGWQPDLTSVGATYGLQATGIFLSSPGGTTLINNGFIGALSDRAIAGDPLVINNGTIEGFVQFTGGLNSIINNGTFNLRHFADTTGGGRDTLRVAIADLGAGPGNSFINTNNGTLRLPAVTGATTLDPTGQYLPLDNPNNAMALGGPLQGHLVGVQTFINSGTIDLQSNPVAGDVLVITGGRQAGLGVNPLIAGPGPGTFFSNGGTLKLDTVLNQGDVATRSDTLVVDGTLVGGLGPTNMVVRNAGVGVEALTVNNGILVVQVLDPTRSDPRAFSLSGGKITAGAFDYFLFHGGVTQGSQGNWYLRNELVAPPLTPPAPGEPAIPVPTPAPGTPPLPTVVPGDPPIPLYDPEVSLKSVVPSLPRPFRLFTLGTFNERQGDQLLVRGDPNTRIGAWGRVFGQGTREHFAEGARPDFDGTFAGFQAGADLLRWESSNGHSDRIGFYAGQARASGAVHGSVDGFEGAPAGHVDLDATSFGGYWTHLGPTNWYIDAVLQGTYFQTSANSIRGFA